MIPYSINKLHTLESKMFINATFWSAGLRAEASQNDGKRTPSPTGYRGETPQPTAIASPDEEDDIIHKVNIQ